MRIRAAVTVQPDAWTDSRFGTLARLLGLPDADAALIRCARLWAWMASHGVALVDGSIIDSALGPGGAKAMEHASLARQDEHGSYEVRGAHRRRKASKR